MGRILIGLLIGLLTGGVATFYFFVGVPSATQLPGDPIGSRGPGEPPAGTVQVILRQEFFNDVLTTIFTEMNQPSFALGGGSDVAPTTAEGCLSTITVLPEGSGVRTGVTLANNRLEAPIAFTGGYNSPFGCFRFTGWANSVMHLRFDRDSQSVVGQLNVETVNLDGVNPVVNAIVTPLVQSTLNSRVNPVKLIDGSQTAVNTPVASAKANLVAKVNDVRAEVKESALYLFIEYDFAGGPFVLPQTQPSL
ncbi:MAG: hypothetical protein ABL984_19450 [Pyrinomonadaceae bacterium]